MGALQPWHILVVALVFVILFGSKRLPDAARGIGRSLRVFKSEVAALEDDNRTEAPRAIGQETTEHR